MKVKTIYGETTTEEYNAYKDKIAKRFKIVHYNKETTYCSYYEECENIYRDAVEKLGCLHIPKVFKLNEKSMEYEILKEF